MVEYKPKNRLELTVGIVDDDHSERALVRIVGLKGIATTIYEHHSPWEALNDLLLRGSDVVLSDYNLGAEINGDEFVRRLREQGYQGLIIGRSSDVKIEELFKRAGADVFVPKEACGYDNRITLRLLMIALATTPPEHRRSLRTI